jgi:hypothetical protein
MKLLKTTLVIGVVMLAFVACQDNRPDTYTIARKGVFYPEENFDVIHVYGFSDNQEMAREIAGYLNESEPDTYNYYKND